jgi:hypothetical protein
LESKHLKLPCGGNFGKPLAHEEPIQHYWPYYHWEDTINRVPQLLKITQWSLFFTNHKQLNNKSAAYKWLVRASSVKGASETGLTQSGPAEFTLLRQGPGLFTAFELFALTTWFESPDFPGFSLPPAPPF